MPQATKTREVTLKSGGKAFFRVVSMAERIKLRNGPFSRMDAEVSRIREAQDTTVVYDASNRIEEIESEVIAGLLCDKDGSLLHGSVEDYTGSVAVDEHRELWEAFMAYAFGKTSGN